MFDHSNQVTNSSHLEVDNLHTSCHVSKPHWHWEANILTSHRMPPPWWNVKQVSRLENSTKGAAANRFFKQWERRCVECHWGKDVYPRSVAEWGGCFLDWVTDGRTGAHRVWSALVWKRIHLMLKLRGSKPHSLATDNLCYIIRVRFVQSGVNYARVPTVTVEVWILSQRSHSVSME